MDFHSPQRLLILFYKKMEFNVQEKCIRSNFSFIRNFVKWISMIVFPIENYCLGFSNSVYKPCSLVFNRFLGLPHPGRAMYRTCIQLESNLASAGDKDGLANARKLFESALTTYDQDVSLWQEYCIMEAKVTFQSPY